MIDDIHYDSLRRFATSSLAVLISKYSYVFAGREISNIRLKEYVKVATPLSGNRMALALKKGIRIVDLATKETWAIKYKFPFSSLTQAGDLLAAHSVEDSDKIILFDLKRFKYVRALNVENFQSMVGLPDGKLFCLLSTNQGVIYSDGKSRSVELIPTEYDKCIFYKDNKIMLISNSGGEEQLFSFDCVSMVQTSLFKYKGIITAAVLLDKRIAYVARDKNLGIVAGRKRRFESFVIYSLNPLHGAVVVAEIDRLVVYNDITLEKILSVRIKGSVHTTSSGRLVTISDFSEISLFQ